MFCYQLWFKGTCPMITPRLWDGVYGLYDRRQNVSRAYLTRLCCHFYICTSVVHKTKSVRLSTRPTKTSMCIYIYTEDSRKQDLNKGLEFWTRVKKKRERNSVASCMYIQYSIFCTILRLVVKFWVICREGHIPLPLMMNVKVGNSCKSDVYGWNEWPKKIILCIRKVYN